MLRVNTPQTPDEIADLRERADLTQQEFAAALGVSMRTIQNWEGGYSEPRRKHRRALAEFALTLDGAAA